MLLEKKIVEQIESVQERLKEQGRLPAQDRLKAYYDLFRSKFGPEVLRLLDGEDLLDLMHNHGNHESLVYWLEFKNDEEFPRIFGSISGGSAFKFKLYKGKDTGEWIAGNAPKNNRVIKVDEAIDIARKHRDQLILGCELLEKLPTDGSDSDYNDLQVQINELAPDVGDTAWGHKYFSLLFPSKLDDYHNADYGRYHLIKLLQQIPLEPGRYVCAGRFVSIAKELSLPMNHLTTVLNEIDGNPHRYWRIGTREGDSGESHWTSMRDGNYVSIGWSELNDLSELIHDQKSKDLLKGLMQERFYPNSPQTAGKKGTEVFRFATIMANGDIVVASDGSAVLGIGKVAGDYAYNSELPFAHIRAVEWLSKDEWKMKDQEGVRTTVSEIKKPENLVEIERHIIGSSPPPPQGPVEPSIDSYKELVLAYSKAVKKVIDGELKFEYLDLESSERRIEELKQLFNKFLDDPTDANLRAFWNTNYLLLSIGGGNVGVLRSKNDVAKIHGVLAELNRSDIYNEEWERTLRSHWPLWELWGRIKDEPLVSFAWTGLNFFGCELPVPFYPGFLKNYERIFRFYQSVIGKERATTYRSEIEINQLFAFIWAVKHKQEQVSDEVQKLDDLDATKAYDLIKRILEKEKPSQRYWVEKTLVKGRTDRISGDYALGKALWSPQARSDGHDIYAAMREIGPGDVVLHLTNNEGFTGVSVAASSVDSSFIGLQGTVWADRAAYLVRLKDYVPLEAPLLREEFLDDDAAFEQLASILEVYKGKGLFYNREHDLNQGAYLTEAPPELVGVLNTLYCKKTGNNLPHADFAPCSRQPRGLQPLYTRGDLLEETGFDDVLVDKWIRSLERKKHIIIQGPPGTGKTYVAERLARLKVSETIGFYETIQFHPTYAYEDFIQGIHPHVEEGALSYEIKAGRFLEFCAKASECADAPCVLIIDEINRANLARVFGELMFLLEYRDKTIPLAYGGKLNIPENVYIIGTMNTADRSIALVDHALRRRFSFIYLAPDYGVLERYLKKHDLPVDSLISVLKLINTTIDDSHYEVGISFFLKDGSRLKDTLPDVWHGEIEPYLEEYFYDRPEKVAPFRWEYLLENDLTEWAP
jgi:hypothetical protein